MSLTVIIPSDNRFCAELCVEAIGRHDPSVQIIVVTDRILPVVGAAHVDAPQPFCFSKSINTGIAKCDGDIIVCNHDAILETPGGFTSLQTNCPEDYGVLSAAVRGACCNPLQCKSYRQGLVQAPYPDLTVSFIAAFIPRRALDKIGLLDEQFIGYGFDDDDACWRMHKAGLKVGIWHDTVVEHDRLPSSFRARPENHQLMQDNRTRFETKYGHDNHGRTISR